MRSLYFFSKLLLVCFYLFRPNALFAQIISEQVLANEKLGYHRIHLAEKTKTIIPWYSSDLGMSYDFIIHKVWNFWDTMRIDKNGLPYYMNHQVWRSDFNDKRGIGGDQFAMALSSWNLYYGYSGNEAVKEEMKFIADYYIAHSFSPPHSIWPNIPFPYNTMIYAGNYDGDMVLGKGYTQPDKAGSFGYELLKLYKMNHNFPWPNITDQQYLNAAIGIANTLAKNIKVGDSNFSPLPFKVNALSGKIGKLKSNAGTGAEEQSSGYTTNWSGTMELFLGLIALKEGDTNAYKKAFIQLLSWMKQYPLINNKWGPFFEDIPGWSDTQINAISFAQFMMNHPIYFPDWKTEVKKIFNWVYHKLGNSEWINYGVTVVNEQTAYQTPGNSHTARQAAAALQYASLCGDSTYTENAIRQLNWATYMVDHDGKNCYPRDEVWMTDGYGDYIRHFLNAMAAYPALSPSNQNHLISTNSVIQLMAYAPDINKFLVPELPVELAKKTMISYRTFDKKSTEIFRTTKKPSHVLVNQVPIKEGNSSDAENWSWMPLDIGGILTIHHLNGNRIAVL